MKKVIFRVLFYLMLFTSIYSVVVLELGGVSSSKSAVHFEYEAF